MQGLAQNLVASKSFEVGTIVLMFIFLFQVLGTTIVMEDLEKNDMQVAECSFSVSYSSVAAPASGTSFKLRAVPFSTWFKRSKSRYNIVLFFCRCVPSCGKVLSTERAREQHNLTYIFFCRRQQNFSDIEGKSFRLTRRIRYFAFATCNTTSKEC